MTTTNLAEFGNRELKIAAKLLTAYADGNFECPYFMDNGVQVMMNTDSGNVFLTNDDYQVLMMNGNELEGFYSSPYEGHEGFIDELIDMWDEDWHSEDSNWLFMLAQDLGKKFILPVKLLETQKVK
jgi:hypothetical protein